MAVGGRPAPDSKAGLQALGASTIAARPLQARASKLQAVHAGTKQAAAAPGGAVAAVSASKVGGTSFVAPGAGGLANGSAPQQPSPPQQVAPADAALARVAAAVQQADTADSSGMLGALREVAAAGKGGALLQVGFLMLSPMRAERNRAGGRCPKMRRQLVGPETSCCQREQEPSAAAAQAGGVTCPLGCRPRPLQEVTSGWDGYPLLQQQDLFGALRAAVGAGDWDQIEEKLEVALSLASLF